MIQVRGEGADNEVLLDFITSGLKFSAADKYQKIAAGALSAPLFSPSLLPPSSGGTRLPTASRFHRPRSRTGAMSRRLQPPGGDSGAAGRDGEGLQRRFDQEKKGL